MDDCERTDGRGPRGLEGLLVLVVVFVGGLVLIGVADRVAHLGPTLGNILFCALPLVAAAAAAPRPRHDD